MIDKFLYFEEKSEITNYKYKFNDEFIWPYFRSTVYEKVQSVGKNFNIPARNIKKENNFLKVI